jgi:hypothetical protein
LKIRSPGITGCTSLPLSNQDTLPIDRAAFRQILQRLDRPYAFDAVDSDEGRHLFIRVPVEVPDAVTDLERAVEELPAWAGDGTAAVYLVGLKRTVHVPGYTVQPLIRQRERAEAEQAVQLRGQLREGYDAVSYRSGGDPYRLLRLAVRLPRARVSDLSDEDLDGVAHATGALVDDGRHRHVDTVILVADEDHLRITARDFFADVADRRSQRRTRPPRDRTQRPADAAPPARDTGFPMPRQDVQPVGLPRRHVQSVEPLLELEEEVDAGAPPPRQARPARVLQQVDAKRLDLATRVAIRVLKLNGFHVITGVYHGTTRYAAAAERPHGMPRRLAVRALDRLTRRDLDTMLVDARALKADLVVAITPDPRAELVRRATGTRVRIIRPEDVADLSF